MANPEDGRLSPSPLTTPGPLGQNDAADPDGPSMAGAVASGETPTPGPTGVNDAATPDAEVLAERERLQAALAEYDQSEKAVIEQINAFIDEAFRLDEQRAELLAERPPEEQARLRSEMGVAASGEIFGPPADYLDKALDLATAARKGHSLDPVLRDTQYYFHTRSRVAATPGILKPFTAFFGGTGSMLWDFAKWALPEGAQSVLMQKDDSNPNSPPGGWVWALVGCSDGLLDHLPEKGRPRYAKSTPRQELRQLISGMSGPAMLGARH